MPQQKKKEEEKEKEDFIQEFDDLQKMIDDMISDLFGADDVATVSEPSTTTATTTTSDTVTHTSTVPVEPNIAQESSSQTGNVEEEDEAKFVLEEGHANFIHGRTDISGDFCQGGIARTTKSDDEDDDRKPERTNISRRRSSLDADSVDMSDNFLVEKRKIKRSSESYIVFQRGTGDSLEERKIKDACESEEVVDAVNRGTGEEEDCEIVDLSDNCVFRERKIERTSRN